MGNGELILYIINIIKNNFKLILTYCKYNIIIIHIIFIIKLILYQFFKYNK